MALYFDYQAKCHLKDSVHIGISLHEKHPILAVSSYNSDNGGFIFICNEEGELLEGINFPTHVSAQVTSLIWHPTRLQIAIGWENGGLQVWTDGQEEFFPVDSPHKDPITLLKWSKQGLRLISADTSGSLIGWKADTRGKLQTVFHHELKDPISQITFRRTSMSSSIDFSGLARAAVAGDEKALDMFSDWRPKTAGQRINFQSEQTDNLCFFAGSISGVIYYIKDNGNCEEVLRADGAIKKLLFHETKDYLIVMTDKLNIGQFHVDVDGKVSEIMKVKINGRSTDASLIWAGEGLLAISAGEPTVRCWDLETGENYLLPMEIQEPPTSLTKSYSSLPSHPNEFFTSLAYYDKKRSMCGSTNFGRVFMWKFLSSTAKASTKIRGSSDKSDGSWVRLGTVSVEGGAIVTVQWGGGRGILAVHTVSGVCLLCEHPVAVCYSNKVAAVQISPSEFLMQQFDGGWVVPLKLHDVRAIGVAIGDNHVAFWDNKKVVVYEASENIPDKFRMIGSFSCKAEDLVIHSRSLYILETVQSKDESGKENPNKTKEEVKVRCHTFQGTVTSTLGTHEEEGEVCGIHLTAPYLIVFTLQGFITVWDISRREAKIHVHPKRLGDVIPDFGEVISAKCNSDGTKMSLTIAKSDLFPDTKLYIWNINRDTFSYLDFATGGTNEDGELSDTSPREASKEKEVHEKAASSLVLGIFDRFVLSHHWDEHEPKLLVCEAKMLPSNDGNIKVTSSMNSTTNLFRRPEVVLVTLFTSPEGEILMQNSVTFPENHVKLTGVEIPHFILLRKPTSVDEATGGGLSDRKVMRDFEGLEDCDKSTRDAVVNFSYYLSMGNMDEAFRAIKTIKSGAIWENMARMCVETKQVDVGAVCLGHMGNAIGARALRKTAGAPLDVRVAVLALHLGLTAEAEKLLNGCGRYDLLNKLYQDSNRWESALQVAEELDRIHLRSTCYNYAKHLEAQGDITRAITMYEKSETHRTEVPRMLSCHEELLESYMKQTKDQVLGSWWGKRLETKGEIQGALAAYEEVDDRSSQVRLRCRFLNDVEAAEKSAGSDQPALFELGRELEKRGKVEGAVRAYTRARAYGNAIRVCKEYDMKEELWNVALTAGPNDQLDAGRYFENADPPAPEKAVHLYHRAGLLHMALELAFRTQQFNALQYIAMDLNANSDPLLSHKCATFFIQNKQFEKAVNLLAMAKKYSEALDLCMKHDVPLTDELAEKLTLEKVKDKADEESRSERAELLEKMAEIAVSQGNLQLAAKKYTQAGNKVKAMKVLLRIGDPEKIIFFANVSRQREIYIMAANYLQSLDWRNEPNIMRNIITFYTKGRAQHLLASFYMACAEVEIDEFQNYEKALNALEEAKVCHTRTISKGSNVNSEEIRRKGEEIERRSRLVRHFVEIQRQYKQDPEGAIQRCQILLEEWQVSGEDAVRRGDVYAFVAEHYAREGNEDEVMRLLREMREALPTGTSLAYYVDASALSKLSPEVAQMLKNDRRESRSVSRASAIHADEDEIAEVEEIEAVKEEEEEEEIEEKTLKGERRNSMIRTNGKVYAI
ncbi:intraflagellar transport protein 140 homolog [Ischnura elegans]|uniref:intraflagellar transport protein 140 homolog n=1 Tax=Ischnura elegans TaxID=197161 RepID=UPI001ED8B9DD|nr:intraflagellar transport protein 140 homolog [Ischnura elegans]